MTVQQLSFKIIPCPMGICSPHTHLVVSGRGVPHEPLTLFYEELQKRCAPSTLHSITDPLLSFFSFLEEPQSLRDLTLQRIQEEWSSCIEAMEVPSPPPGMAWAGPPSELEAAVRFYLAARWGCRTRQHGRYEDILLITEGAELYCERRGTGPLLLLIAGGLGDAGQYSAAASILADEFTVVTYDRRCHSRSTGDRTAAMTVAQQARDAAAIIEAQGEDPALIFGTSGGGTIALELATTRPDLIDFLVIHEAPVIELLPDVEQWRAFVDDISAKLEREGAGAAMMAFTRSLNREPSTFSVPDLFQPMADDIEFFFRQEYRPITLYTPDLERIRNNEVRMAAACGRGSGDAYYARATRVLAEKLGCEYVEFPGHHTVSLDAPKEFAKTLRDVLERRKA